MGPVDRRMNGRRNLIVASMVASALLATLATASCSSANNPGYDNTAQNVLMLAGQSAKAFYSANVTYQGFDPAFASQSFPEEKWITSGNPTVGEMAIRDDSANEVLIVTKSSSGHYFCITETVSGETRGSTNAQTVAQCTGNIW
jgi:hypothetical protein